ncbi:hypothetical protein LINPERPRIM_LOCUS6725 [Linum perenne]
MNPWYESLISYPSFATEVSSSALSTIRIYPKARLTFSFSLSRSSRCSCAAVAISP